MGGKDREGVVMVTCRMPWQEVEELDNLAKRLGVTRSEVVRACIRDGKKEGETVAAWMESGVMRSIMRQVMKTQPGEVQQRFKEMVEAMERDQEEKKGGLWSQVDGEEGGR